MTTVIVSMPFMEVDRPSIQLGLLKAIGEAHGLPVRTLHANLDFAARIGIDYYQLLAEHRGRLVGDWLFSVEAFGDAAPDPDGELLDEFAAELSYLDDAGVPVRERLLAMRKHDVPAYLDALIDEFAGARVVGFSSTFQQNTASFALARRLKQRYPDILTVFGGANFDGEMGVELVRSIDCIDYAVIGEADTAFPRLLAGLAAGEDPAGIPGVARRVGDRVVATPPAEPHARLDELPTPDYTEYFDRAARHGAADRTRRDPVRVRPRLLVGRKAPLHLLRAQRNHHAVPRQVAGPRARRAGRAVPAAPQLPLRRRRQHPRPALPEGAAPTAHRARPDYQIFYEVKANLTRAQLKALAAAGVSRMQPGLESLSSRVLSLMDKGVRAAQNVNLLRWARYYGITVGWNILWGFPGETAEDYAEQAAAVPHLAHLQPPASVDRIWLERFSPLFTRPERFPMRWRRPEASYRYVYPATTDLDRIAYFFDYEPEDALTPAAYTPLSDAAAEWSALWETGEPPVLVYRSAPGFLQIYDGRPERQGTYTFHDTLAAIYLACVERPRTAAAVHSELGLDVPVAAVQDAFRRFAERGLMFLDDDLVIALAIPATLGR